MLRLGFGGCVGLVIALRLGYLWWCWTTRSYWHKALFSSNMGGLTLFKKVRNKSLVVVYNWLIRCG